MSDSIDNGYLSNLKKRRDKEMEALLAETDQLLAEEEAAKAKPQAQPQAQPTAKQAEAPKVGIGDVARDSASAVVYAGAGVYDSVVNLVADAADATASLMFNERILGRSDLSGYIERTGFSKPELVGGQVGKELLQWALPFASTLKAANATKAATTTLGKAGQAAAAGAVADTTSLTDNLSRMMVDLGDKYPWMKNFVTEALATDPNSPDWEKRLKNLAEGGILGTTVEGVMSIGKLLRAANAHFRANGKDPVKAIQEAEKKAAEEATKAEAEAAIAVQPQTPEKTPLQKQIELATGVKENKKNYQRYLDVKAAVEEADAAKAAANTATTPAPVKPGDYDPNLMKNAEGVEIQTPSRELTQAEKNEIAIKAVMESPEAAETPARRVLLDTADNTISIAKEAPTATQVDLGNAVNQILRPGYSKTLQADAALVPIQTPSRELTQAEKNQFTIDATMRKHLEAYKAMQDQVLGAVNDATKKIAPVADSTPAKGGDTVADKVWEAGDTITYKGGAESGEVLRVAKGGKVVIRDDRTGKTVTVTPDADDPLVEAIKANDKKIKKAAGKKNQGGFIDPSLLAQMVAAQAGGLVGFMSADDDATMADKLALAGVYALGGMGIARVGMNKLKNAQEARKLTEQLKQLEDLSRPEVRNIAPVAIDPALAAKANTKKPPIITKDKVDALVSIAKEGDVNKLMEAAKESDFNFDYIDTADDVKNMIDNFSSVFEKQIDKATHGVQTDAQLKELADEIGSGTGSLKELYQDTNNLGARIFAHRALLTASAEKVTSLAKLARSGDADALLALRKHVALHASIQSQMKGVQTEVARALRQFRLTSTSVDLAINERNDLIEALGGHAANMDFAAKLAEISDPKKLAAVVRKGALSRSSDALYEAWVNGLLSSPVTHAVNLMGNAMVAVGAVAEKGVAALIGASRRAIGSTDETINAEEVRAQVFGMMEGIIDTLTISKGGRETLSEAFTMVKQGDVKGAKELIAANKDEFGTTYQAFATDLPVLDNAAFATKEADLMGRHAITGNNLVPQSGAVGSMIDNAGIRKQVEGFVDVLGTIARTPGRFLTASDELFKTIHYRGEMKAQAYREARLKGLDGEEFVAEVARLLDNPSPTMSALSLKAAREGTFTNPLGSIGRSLNTVVHKAPALRYIVPFIRTPINIMKYVGVRTPLLNRMAESVRAEYAAGGIRRDMMMAKTSTGAMLYGAGLYLASQGYITGGGEKRKEAEKLGGMQPYSFKIGDTYYAFNRLDPQLGMFFSLAADLHEIMGAVGEAEGEELATAAMLAISRNLVSKTYLSGIVDIIEVISSQSPNKAERWFQKFGSSFTPMSAMSGTIRREADPHVREVNSLIDAVKNRIPGLSDSLPPAVNIFGEDIKYTGGIGPDWLSPIRTTEEATLEAAKEIARLNLDLRPPMKTIGGGNGSPPIDLTPQQYYKLMKHLGEGFKPSVTKLVESEKYKKLPEDPNNNTYLDAKEKVIKELYEKHKRVAVAKLLREDKELQSKMQQSKQNVVNALLGFPTTDVNE